MVAVVASASQFFIRIATASASSRMADALRPTKQAIFLKVPDYHYVIANFRLCWGGHSPGWPLRSSASGCSDAVRGRSAPREHGWPAHSCKMEPVWEVKIDPACGSWRLMGLSPSDARRAHCGCRQWRSLVEAIPCHGPPSFAITHH
jgi:hypothetical protein